MARLTLAGGKLDEYGDKLPLGRLFNGEVIEGLKVSPTSTASTSVQVAPGSGFFRTGAVPGNWAYPFVLDTTGGLTVAAPTAQSQPMLVDVVAALDLTAISTSSTNNPNSWALYAVGGTPNASPVRPSNAQIQSAVGSSKPYIKLGWFQHDSTTASSGITVVNDARVLVRPYAEGPAGALVTDGSGNVTVRNISFRAYRAAAFALPRSATTKILFDTTDYSLGGGFYSSGGYTIPATGIYHVTAMVVAADNPMDIKTMLYKNNVLLADGQHNGGAAIHTAVGSDYKLSQGDVIDVRSQNFRSDRDPSIGVGTEMNWLTVRYVGPSS